MYKSHCRHFNFTVIAVALLLVVSCNNTEKKGSDQNDRLELIPEPDKAERLNYEAMQALKSTGCILTPDTSISNFNLRDAKAASIILIQDTADSIGQYHYYSKLKTEILTLTQHPGDEKNVISMFAVASSNNSGKALKTLESEYFISSKGIHIGMDKDEIIQRLGSCYAALDSSENYIELYYRIEQPADTKSDLLRRYNMPVYYGSYQLTNNTLKRFEFGFEYP